MRTASNATGELGVEGLTFVFVDDVLLCKYPIVPKDGTIRNRIDNTPVHRPSQGAQSVGTFERL
jgi:hypothetical protein